MIVKKTIGELNELKFYIPAYQRGYRWTESEVTALLEDVSNVGDKQYCLQPLIVQKKGENEYEVVDGQQRLTTIYIFLKIVMQKIKSEAPLFELSYETREKSREFLQSLFDENFNDNSNIYKSNIDFYHMYNAYISLNNWLTINNSSLDTIKKLNDKIRDSVFFIWYEIPEESNPISIFTKVNLGKIPLTNAELIKALILSKDNFIDATKKDDAYRIHKLQLEISMAWDRIEQDLQEDSFWYFLNKTERIGTRIDLLFEICAKELNEKMGYYINEDEKYFSFLVFLNEFQKVKTNRKDFVDSIWNRIKKIHEEFIEWYRDLDYYHIIGFLISVGVSIEEIFELTRNKRKSEIRAGLISKMKDFYTANLSYLEFKSDKKKIKNILLLFNIATLVCKSERQYRFPFDIYKKEKWDIEHIHATADETAEEDDSIENLTLLDYSTNRSYKDAPFEEKRKIIISREANGQFVPLCTKNVFLKVYTNKIKNMKKWDDNDKQDYVASIKSVIENFLEGGKNIE